MRPCYFYSHVERGSSQIPAKDDPFSITYYVGDSALIREECFNRCFQKSPLDPLAPLTGSLSVEFFTRATGLWPLSRPAPRLFGMPLMLCDLKPTGAYRLRPTLESKNGVRCQVLERTGFDTLWIDMARNGAVIARRLISPAEPAQMEYDLYDHKPCNGSIIWLPRRIVATRSERKLSSNPVQFEITNAVEVAISECEINSLHREDFTCHVPGGSIVLTTGKAARWEQTSSNSPQQLERTADWLTRYYTPSIALTANSVTTSRVLGAILAFAAGGWLATVALKLSQRRIRPKPITAPDRAK
jgi:hypothetical protein